MSYIRCVYCGVLTQDLDHVSACPWDGMNEIGEPEKCYSCGKTGQSYSASQWTRDHPRCKTCVAANKTRRHQPFYFEAFANHLSCDIGFQELRSACFTGRYDTVLSLIEQGINPHIVPVKTTNRVHFDSVYSKAFHEPSGITYRVFSYAPPPYIVYDEKGQALEDRDENDPYNLLRACVFGVANIMLDDEHRWSMAKIATLLIEHGLDKNDARAYFESRYGDYANTEKEDSPFKALYDVLLANV